MGIKGIYRQQISIVEALTPSEYSKSKKGADFAHIPQYRNLAEFAINPNVGFRHFILLSLPGYRRGPYWGPTTRSRYRSFVLWIAYPNQWESRSSLEEAILTDGDMIRDAVQLKTNWAFGWFQTEPMNTRQEDIASMHFEGIQYTILYNSVTPDV